MQKRSYSFILFLFMMVFSNIKAQINPSGFTVIPLGVKGGGDESNLSSYMVAPTGDSNFICLDAGTIRAGIQQAINRRVLKGNAEYILQNRIRAYFISHPHLDHLSGMIINSPDDIAKPVYGLPFCLNTIAEKYFSWKSWANFSDRGETPQLKKFVLKDMIPGEIYPVEKTSMKVSAFPLSHAMPQESTAFLVNHLNDYLLYLGDTGADTVEKSQRLAELWKNIAPLLQSKKLKTIFIEVSFSNEQKKDLLFGHLTPDLLMLELRQLSTLAGPGSLKNFPVIITHRKPGGDREERIRKELTEQNDLNVKFIFAEQAVPIHL